MENNQSIPPNQPQTVSQSDEVESEKKPISKPLLYLLGFLVVGLIVTSAYFFYQNQQLKQQAELHEVDVVPEETLQISPTITDATESWEEYGDREISFKYPPDWDTLRIGENQETLMVAPKPNIDEVSSIQGGFGGGPFLVMTVSWRQHTPPLSSDEFQRVTESDITIGDKPAQRYDIEVIKESPMGNPGDRYVSIYVNYGTGNDLQYLGISLHDQQYRDIFDQILSTFRFSEKSEKIVVVTSPKNSDSPSEMNQYQVSFAKPTTTTTHLLTENTYQELKIYGENYEVSISFPTDGGSTALDKPPLVEMVTNHQFGEVNRISTNENRGLFYYSNNYDADCASVTPKPAGGCGLMLVGFKNPQSDLGTTSVAVSCQATTVLGINSCDRVVSSLAIEQIN